MKLTPNFSENDLSFSVNMSDANNTKPFEFGFSEVSVIERTDIPPQYGLVTYDNTKTITVS